MKGRPFFSCSPDDTPWGMEFSASQVHKAHSEVRNQLESRVGIDAGPLDWGVIHERNVAPAIGAEPVEQRRENLSAEWVVEVDNQVAPRERERGRVGAHEANVAAGHLAAIGRPVILRHLEEGRGDLDPHDLAIGAPRGVEHHPPQARADVDQGGAFRCERHRVEQAVDVGDRRRLVVGREFQIGTDRLGIEFAEEDQRLGRDAVRGVEALARAAAQWTSALASVSSTPSAANVGPKFRTAASVAGRG
jgi:hypothetical protein